MCSRGDDAAAKGVIDAQGGHALTVNVTLPIGVVGRVNDGEAGAGDSDGGTEVVVVFVKEQGGATGAATVVGLFGVYVHHSVPAEDKRGVGQDGGGVLVRRGSVDVFRKCDAREPIGRACDDEIAIRIRGVIWWDAILSYRPRLGDAEEVQQIRVVLKWGEEASEVFIPRLADGWGIRGDGGVDAQRHRMIGGHGSAAVPQEFAPVVFSVQSEIENGDVVPVNDPCGRVI